MTNASTIDMISADSHVNEPRDLWFNNLPSKLRDQAMRGIEARDDGGWEVVLEGEHIGKAATPKSSGLRYSSWRTGSR